MKVYVSLDLEGIYGINFYDSIKMFKNRDAYKRWKKYASGLYGDETLIVIETLQEFGFEHITLFDGHGSGGTLDIGGKKPGITEAVSKGKKTLLPLLDGSYDGIILWGYHVKSGCKDGKLPHTYSRRIKKFSLNGKPVGEVYLHSYIAAELGVPLLAVSGDSFLGIELKNDIGDIPFFDSNRGKEIDRDNYLKSIRRFISELDITKVIDLNKRIDWPSNFIFEVEYYNPLINIARWLIKEQYKFAKLNSVASSSYHGKNIRIMLDNFAGISN